jgi:hypothetical protein
MHWIGRLVWTVLIAAFVMVAVFLGAPTAKALYVGATTHDGDAAGQAAAELGEHLGNDYGPYIGWGSALAGFGVACIGFLPGTRRRKLNMRPA